MYIYIYIHNNIIYYPYIYIYIYIPDTIADTIVAPSRLVVAEPRDNLNITMYTLMND